MGRTVEQVREELADPIPTFTRWVLPVTDVQPAPVSFMTRWVRTSRHLEAI